VRSGFERDEEDKNKFYEGASWLGQQAVNEIDKKIDEGKKLRDAFENRKKECGDNGFMQKRNTEWIIEQQEKLTRDSKGSI